jgi:hypothetical protein
MNVLTVLLDTQREGCTSFAGVLFVAARAQFHEIAYVRSGITMRWPERLDRAQDDSVFFPTTAQACLTDSYPLAIRTRFIIHGGVSMFGRSVSDLDFRRR